jgi:hypothetical protein
MMLFGSRGEDVLMDFQSHVKHGPPVVAAVAAPAATAPTTRPS